MTRFRIAALALLALAALADVLGYDLTHVAVFGFAAVVASNFGRTA